MAKMKAWKLPSSDGDTVASKDLKGEAYVLYFYPKDMTPGCTTEACDFRDNLSKLKRAGVKVFGVSPDPIKRHEKFIEKEGLNFPLLADEDHAIAEKLGVWGQKKMAGREYMGVIRATFLVDADGNTIMSAEQLAAAGLTVNENGELVDANGNIVDPNDLVVTSDGRVLNKKELEKAGFTVNASGLRNRDRDPFGVRFAGPGDDEQRKQATKELRVHAVASKLSGRRAARRM